MLETEIQVGRLQLALSAIQGACARTGLSPLDMIHGAVLYGDGRVNHETTAWYRDVAMPMLGCIAIINRAAAKDLAEEKEEEDGKDDRPN